MNNNNWQTARLYPPDRLTIQVTNICNANCTFCGYQYLEDKKGFIDEEIFYSAVDQYQSMGGERINMTPLVGDLLIDKHIFKKLNYIKNKNHFKKVSFYTNGILLNRKGYAEKLLDCSPTDVAFSVPGFDKDLYERVYRSKAYKQMLRGVHRFIKMNKDAGSPIKVSFALKPDRPDNEVVYTEDYCKYIEPYISEEDLSFVRDLDNWGGSIKESDLTGNMRMAKNIAIEQKTYPCYFTFFLALLIDGQVRLCGCRFNNGTEYDGLVVGNLKENSLLEIWNSEKTNQIRANFTKKKLNPVCESCTHYAPYSGKERSKHTTTEYYQKTHA